MEERLFLRGKAHPPSAAEGEALLVTARRGWKGVTADLCTVSASTHKADYFVRVLGAATRLAPGVGVETGAAL